MSDEESDDDDSDFEYCNKTNGKLAHVDVDKRLRVGGKTRGMTLVPNKSKEEISNIGENGDRNVTLKEKYNLRDVIEGLDQEPLGSIALL